MGKIVSFGGPPQGGGCNPSWEPDTIYVFAPPVLADGIPAHKPPLCKMQLLRFRHGLYLGYIEGKHVFMGEPVLDPRNLPNNMRECFFYVTPDTTGSKMLVETPPVEQPRQGPAWVYEILRNEEDNNGDLQP